MSSSRNPRGKVRLQVSAAPATEIFVINHAFQLTERGTGSLQTDLEPGLYKIKFRAGSLIKEVHQELRPGKDIVRVTSPALPFSSAVPLAATLTTHESHEHAARTLSREVHQALGEGSQLFLFARAWTRERKGRRSPPVRARHHPAKGLTLRDINGKLLLNIERRAIRGDVTDPWAGCNVAVKPGAYLLRVDTPRWGPLEQIIIAPRGWQAQVFLLQDDYGRGSRSAFRPDLATASILLSEPGYGFDPDRDDLRITELARQALANRRTVLTAAELEQMLQGKWKNPMLGIYGAHLLLAAERPARSVLREVIRNLTDLIGTHPDVEAVRLAVEGRAGRQVAFSVPPMLASSWSVIVRHSVKQPHLVPSGSLASRVAPHLWGNGPWVIWLGQRVKRRVPARPLSAREPVSQLAAIGAALDAGRAVETRKLNLSDTEEALLSHVARAKQRRGDLTTTDTRTQRPPRGAARAQRERRAPSAEQMAYDEMGDQLAEALALPPSALQDTLEALNKKLA